MRTKKQWQERVLPKIIERFTPRIQKDLQTIPFPKEIEKAKSIFLYGEVGVGKTIRAVHIVLQQMEERYMKIFPLTFEFLTVWELLNEIKETYNSNSEIQEKEILEKYTSTPLLVIDDFGIEKDSAWVYSIVYQIINHRYEYLLPTIITSNLSLGELAKKLGDDRIPSRIERMCVIYELT